MRIRLYFGILQTMNVFAISDLHLSGACAKPMDIFGTGWDGYWDKIRADWHARVKEDDIVLIAGDISWAMQMQDAMVDLMQIAQLPGHKVLLRGNHDYWWSSLARLRAQLPAGMYVVQNDCVRIGSYRICGSRLWSLGPNPTEEDKKILDREYIRLELSLQCAARDLQEGERILAMTHYPPFDVTARANRYTELMQKYGVSKVVYGHLHGKDCRAMPYREIGGIGYYLTSCDKVDNRLVRIEGEEAEE